MSAGVAMHVKSRTPKQHVQAKYPAAFSYQWTGSVCIYRPHFAGNMCLGSGATASLAWADALANIKKGKV